MPWWLHRLPKYKTFVVSWFEDLGFVLGWCEAESFVFVLARLLVRGSEFRRESMKGAEFRSLWLARLVFRSFDPPPTLPLNPKP